MTSPVTGGGRRRALALVTAVVAGLVLLADEAGAASRPVPLPVPGRPTATVPAELRRASGPVSVVVQLSEQPVAATVPEGAVPLKTLPSAASQRATTAKVQAQQDTVAAAAEGLGAHELASVDTALNAIAVQVDASQLDALVRIPGVVSVRPVMRYSNEQTPAASGSLAQAARYLTADAVRAQGFDGTGVRVAVLDSGIDYTHANLGGPGTLAQYQQCYSGPSGTAYDLAPAGPCAALFGPGNKVVGGYDFVGESWPNSAEVPDPNPIDAEGHGTHVADILGGRSADGAHVGLAPGVEMYSVKVCSARATACSGIALIQGVDFALDPNGDGDISDAVDLINLSVGTDYGGRPDDLSFALDNAVRAGVSVVASAGNGGDRPFKVGQPSIASRVISVAQTTLPDDVSYVIDVNSPAIPTLPDNSVKVSVLQDWSGPVSATLTSDVVAPSRPIGCTRADYPAPTAGKVVIATRGTCAVSQKAQSAQAAGATGMILVNNLPGLPPSFSFGGGTPVTIPVLVVGQSQGEAIKAVLTSGVNVTIDPASAVAIANTMVATSSRGPSNIAGLLKPDLGGPGAWLSAEVGTGSAETGFGGTSGAAPTVAGIAALLIDKFPGNAPAQIKARLLNGADTNNTTPTEDGSYYPTPISRIGAGEVRAAASADATTIVRNHDNGGGNIALGIRHLAGTASFRKTITLRNLNNVARTYKLEATFRDAADAALGALSVSAPSTLTVPANGSRDVTVTFNVVARKLPAWPFTSTAGTAGASGPLLDGPEIDGNLLVTSDTGEQQHLGWQILPHRSANASGPAAVTMASGSTKSVPFRNTAGPLASADAEVTSLLATSPKLPAPKPGQPGSDGSNVAIVDLAAVGVWDNNIDRIAFTIAGYGRRPTPLYPAGYEVDIDTDRDGHADYSLFNGELDGYGISGQSVGFVQKAGTTTSTAYFHTIGDFDSANLVLSAPLTALGLTPGQTFDLQVIAYDNLFSGQVTDATEKLTYTVGSPVYTVPDGVFSVPAGATTQVAVTNAGPVGVSSVKGILVTYADASVNEFQAMPIELT